MLAASPRNVCQAMRPTIVSLTMLLSPFIAPVDEKRFLAPFTGLRRLKAGLSALRLMVNPTWATLTTMPSTTMARARGRTVTTAVWKPFPRIPRAECSSGLAMTVATWAHSRSMFFPPLRTTLGMR